MSENVAVVIGTLVSALLQIAKPLSAVSLEFEIQ